MLGDDPFTDPTDPTSWDPSQGLPTMTITGPPAPPAAPPLWPLLLILGVVGFTLFEAGKYEGRR